MPRRLALLRLAATTAAVIALAACGDPDGDAGDATTTPADESVTDVSLVPATQPTASVPEVQLPSELPTELVVTELAPGDGPAAAEGDLVAVNYVGVRSADGQQFDTSFGGEPFAVTLGAGRVIPGWDQGLVGSQAGQRLQLDIPADLAYGDQPQGDVIQADDALTFVIDVLSVVPGEAPSEADIPATDVKVTDVTSDDVRPGTGATLALGDTGLFHLVAARADDGTVLSSSWDAREPQELTVTEEGLVPGLADGLVGMQVGGRRVVTLPYDASSGLTPETDVLIIADLLATY